jgi:hypothetical protein
LVLLQLRRVDQGPGDLLLPAGGGARRHVLGAAAVRHRAGGGVPSGARVGDSAVGGLQLAVRRLRAGQPGVRHAGAAADGPAGAQGHAEQGAEQRAAGHDRHCGVRGTGAGVGRGDLRAPLQAARAVRRPGV